MKKYIGLLLAFPFSGFSQVYSADSDAWIWSLPAARNLNFGKPNSQNGNLHNVLRAESWQWAAGRNDTIRFLIHFPVDTINPQEIDSAFLNLKFFANANFTQQVGQNAFYLHPIVDAWQETQVTWANQPAFNDQVFMEGTTSQSDTQSYRLNITSFLKTALQQQATGFMVKLRTEVPFAGLSFASREHQQSGLHPKLIVYRQSGLALDEASETNLEINNPFSNELSIKTNDKNAEFQIIDSKGCIVFSGCLMENLIVDTSTWPKGLYFLRIDDQSHRLIKF